MAGDATPKAPETGLFMKVIGVIVTAAILGLSGIVMANQQAIVQLKVKHGEMRTTLDHTTEQLQAANATLHRIELVLAAHFGVTDGD